MLKTISKYFKDIKAKKNPIVLYLLVLLGLVLYVFINTRFAVFNLDDIGFLKSFSVVKENSGVLKAIDYFAMNKDMSGNEYRTYGLAKVFHFLIFLLAKNNPYIYTVILYTLHFLSGILIFKVLKKLIKNTEVAFLCAIIWVFNPFTLVKTFHHFTYLFLPIYLILIYVFVNFKTYDFKNSSIKSWLINIFLILSIAFTGEASIPLIITIISLFIFFNLKSHNKVKTKTFLLHLFILLTFLTIHFLYFKLYVLNNDIQARFSLALPSDIINRLGAFVFSFFSVIKMDLFINSSDYDVYRGTIKYGLSHPIKDISLYIKIFFIIFYLIILNKIIDKKEQKTSISLKATLISFVIFISTIILYITLNILSGSLFPIRYGHVVIPSLICFLVIAIYYFIKKQYIARLISYSLCFLLIYFTAVNLFIATPDIYKQHNNIVEILNDPKNRTKKAVLIVNSNPHFSNQFFKTYPIYPSIINPFFTALDTPFKAFWTSARYIVNIIGYEYAGYKFKEINQDQILLTGEFEDKIYNKNDILIIGNSDLNFFSEYKKNISLISFNNWNDFYNSPLYYGVEVYSNTKNNLSKNFIHSFDTDYITGVDAASINAKPLKADNIFTNLPLESPLKIIINFQELWEFNQDERIFNIIISTDTNKIEFKNIDLFAIGGDDPISIALNTPKTKNLDIRFTTNIGVLDSIRFVKGIFIYKNTQNN